MVDTIITRIKEKSTIEKLVLFIISTIVITLLTVNGWLVQAGVSNLDKRVSSNKENISLNKTDIYDLNNTTLTHITADTTSQRYITIEMLRLTKAIDILTEKVNNLRIKSSG